MVIADTSIWIDHLRQPLEELVALLSTRKIVQHPFVIAEIALGSIAQRRRVVAGLAQMASIKPVVERELLQFVENKSIFATGLGMVDAHLLAACHVHSLTLWTRDKRLLAQAERLGLAFDPSA